MTLTEALPHGGAADDVLDTVLTWLTADGLELYPAQEEALLELAAGSHVVLSTPTGSGKSLVALGAHALAVADGRRTFYTAPVKALVSEKFFDLCRALGPDNVGMLTGDASVNVEAPVICATAEVLAGIALREGPQCTVRQVVMDEFHYYGDRDRGWAWQVPLIELPQAQFLLMSATLGDTARIVADLERRTGQPTAAVTSVTRPVPLVASFSLDPVHDAILELLSTHQAPVYIVHVTQASAFERAQALMSLTIIDKPRRELIAERLAQVRFTAGFGRILQRLLRHGIGVHHAGMLPRYRRLVERLAQEGLLGVVCGTDTLGIGVNLPIRTVLMTSLSKYDGQRVRILTAREFHQISGRAGRAGYDTMGRVVVQAPDHVIENEKALAKVGDDPKKRRKVVRRKPPEGTVSWGRPTFERLLAAEPEPLESSYRISHAMVLQVVARPGDAFASLRHLIMTSDEPRPRQLRHARRALSIARELLTAGVVEALPEPDALGRRWRLTGDLQRDFALDQPLSAFAVAAFDLLDAESPTFALDLMSILESTLDNPRAILLAQRHKARGEAVMAMKAEGIEYEERMELLEEVDYPQPLADLLAAAFETYRSGHPWLSEYPVSPKSVARDLSERAMTFAEYVAFYGMSSSEGLVLRYLADAYKALRRTVPERLRTEEILDLTAWLGEVVRQVDSSLIDEWQGLMTGDATTDASAAETVRTSEDTPPPVTANHRAFRVLVRNALFRRVEMIALGRIADLGDLDAESGWDADRWRQAMGAYADEHPSAPGRPSPGTGPDARGPDLFLVDEQQGRWVVRQVLDDPDADHDWSLLAEVDLAASDAEGHPVLRLLEFGPTAAL